MTNNIAKFFYKLGYSLSCGVPLISGLERLSIDLSNDTWKVEIEKLIEGIKDGHSFTSALVNKTAIEADEVLIGILDAGERAGTFDENLQKAAQSIEKGLFSIWTVDTIDDALELMTDISVLPADEDGIFPEDSLHALVLDGLDRLDSDDEEDEEEDEEAEEPVIN